MSKKIIIQLLIGVAILLWLFQLANLADTFAVLMQVDLLNLLVAAALFVAASTFVGFALFIPLRRFNQTAPIRKVVMASFAGQLLSDVTPVRSGYFMTPVFLNHLAGVPLDQGMIGVLATGGVNALVKAVICLLGLVYFIGFLPLQAAVINSLLFGVVVLLAAGTVLLFLMWDNRISKIVASLERIPILGSKLHSLTDVFIRVQREGQKIKCSLMIVAVLILVSLIVNATALYFIFNGVWHNSLSILDFFIIASFASTLTYVPITIAGLGVQEAGYVLLLQILLGIPFTNVDPRLLAFALITRALYTGTDIIGIVPLLKVGLMQDTAIKSKIKEI